MVCLKTQFWGYYCVLYTSTIILSNLTCSSKIIWADDTKCVANGGNQAELEGKLNITLLEANYFASALKKQSIINYPTRIPNNQNI